MLSRTSAHRMRTIPRVQIWAKANDPWLFEGNQCTREDFGNTFQGCCLVPRIVAVRDLRIMFKYEQ